MSAEEEHGHGHGHGDKAEDHGHGHSHADGDCCAADGDHADGDKHEHGHGHGHADGGDADGFVDISGDGGLMKKILVEGRGDATPTSGSDVSVHYVGTLTADGSGFDSSRERDDKFNFSVGVGQVIKGWDVGIQSMKKGERCILRCSSDYGYGDRGSPPKIPGGASLDFDVELFTWKEKVKEPHQMSAEERSAFAIAKKEAGNAAFKAKDYHEAAELYSDGARYITFSGGGGHSHGHGHSHGGEECHADHGGGESAPLEDAAKTIALNLLTNCAAARLKIGSADGAAEDCTRALEIDDTNAKALFRRGQAYLATKNYGACVKDATALLKVDPENKSAAQLLKKAAAQQKKEKDAEKKMYSKMFK